MQKRNSYSHTPDLPGCNYPYVPLNIAKINRTLNAVVKLQTEETVTRRKLHFKITRKQLGLDNLKYPAAIKGTDKEWELHQSQEN